MHPKVSKSLGRVTFILTFSHQRSSEDASIIISSPFHLEVTILSKSLGKNLRTEQVETESTASWRIEMNRSILRHREHRGQKVEETEMDSCSQKGRRAQEKRADILKDSHL